MNLDHTWVHIMNKEGKGRRLTKEEFIQKMEAKSSTLFIWWEFRILKLVRVEGIV